DSLKENGFNVENVIRLTSKEKNYPTQTIKITFNDPQNRNTFVQTGLQIDSMHFTAKPAIQNSKPVQCYLCLKYNHVAKFCKTKQQLCARCGENHHYDQCPNTQVSPKCCNCIGEHLANLSDCPTYREQERRIHKTINQYSTTTKQTRTTTVPILNNNDEFPPLTNVYIRQHDISHNTMIDEILNILTFKMEKILEETTNRLLNIINRKINKLQKSLCSNKNLPYENATETEIDNDDDDDEIQALNVVSPSATTAPNASQTATSTSNTITPAPPKSIATSTKGGG
ncbi:unnamed protein product, partial [Rotaria sp. Silwood1]